MSRGTLRMPSVHGVRGIYQPVLADQPRQRDAVADREFLEQTRLVGVDGFRAEVQPLGDGFLAHALVEQQRDFHLAKNVGAKQMLLWEADYIDGRANAAELKAAMSAT